MNQENQTEPETRVDPIEENPQASTADVSSQEETPIINAAPKDADNWQEARKVLSLQKSRIEQLEAQLQELARPKTQEVPEVDEFDKLDPTELISIDQAKKLIEKKAEKQAKKAAQEALGAYDLHQRLLRDEERMRSDNSDYDYVVENYVGPLLKKDPALAHFVKTSENPAETAYRLGKLTPAYKKNEEQVMSPKAERIIKNSQKPVPPHAVSGGNPPLKDQAQVFEKMNKQDIWKLSQQYARSG